MRAESRRWIVVAALIAGAGVALSAGGWSVITIDEFPDYVMARKPLALTFSVRQHGIQLVSGLKPLVQATAPGAAPVVVRARPTARAGEYTATLALDREGDWAIVVDGGFNQEDRTRRYNSIALPTLRVVGADTAAPLVLFSEAERGATLLVSKGCVSCHAPGSARDVTRKPLTAEHVKALLTDAGVRPPDMPDLRLKPAEVAALTAYVTGSRVSVLGSR
jgi:hypothetical protein